MEHEQNAQFYKHFYNETLFIVPGERQEQSAEAAPEQAVAHAAKAPEPAVAAKPDFTVSGQNRKGVVVLVQLPEPQFAVFKQNEFLWKVLGAVQCSKEDVALVNLEANRETTLEALAATVDTRFLISFSKNAFKTPSGQLTEPYKPFKIQQVPVIIAEPLDAIEADVSKKKLLWAALQQVFK